MSTCFTFATGLEQQASWIYRVLGGAGMDRESRHASRFCRENPPSPCERRGQSSGGRERTDPVSSVSLLCRRRLRSGVRRSPVEAVLQRFCSQFEKRRVIRLGPRFGLSFRSASGQRGSWGELTGVFIADESAWIPEGTTRQRSVRVYSTGWKWSREVGYVTWHGIVGDKKGTCSLLMFVCVKLTVTNLK